MARHETPIFHDLLDALQHHAERDPDRLAFTFVVDDGQNDARLSFGELLDRTIQIGSSLSDRTAAGERVLLMLPPSLDFIPTFWGASWAGLVPCVAYPPVSPSATAAVASLFREVQASCVITSEATASSLAATPHWKELGLPEPIAWETLENGASKRKRRDTELAFIQFTSGSTSSSKGVRVTRKGLASHCEQARAAFHYDRHTVAVYALPLNHCFGLFAALICPTYVGHTCAQLSPQRFAEQPLSWLKAIDRFRGTVSAAPNFAYELLCRSMSDVCASDMKLDLSCLRFAGMGGEVMQPSNLGRVADVLRPFGLSADALKPAYGLSEATMYISGSATTGLARVAFFDGPALRRGQVESAAPNAANARAFVGVGPVIPGSEVVLVDLDTSRRAERGRVGEIWFRGPGVADGYWGRPEASEAAFGAKLEATGPRYLRTGDLGFIDQGELFVSGRCKELIVVDGLRFFPSELEASVRECGPEVAGAAMAAFPCAGAGGAGFALAIELDPPSPALAERIFARIARDHQIECELLIFAPTSSLPRTTRGKVQRLGVASLASESRLPGVTLRRSQRAGP